jgi:hypothetical protein
MRPHAFAAERLGFVSAKAAAIPDGMVLFAERYFPVADADYIPDDSVGAMMGQEAIRKALEIALLQKVGMFHIHLHDHRGMPRFSRTDLLEQPKFVPDFFKVRAELPHGAIVLSHDHAAGRVWLDDITVVSISEFIFAGAMTSFFSTVLKGTRG